MTTFANKLKTFIWKHQLAVEHLTFSVSCHSVAEAAAAVNAKTTDLVKNICLIGPNGKLVVAIVPGDARVSTKKVANLLGFKKMRMATAAEILERTGYPCGGTPSFGFPAIFLMDKSIFTLPYVYTGGGSETSLVKADPQVLQAANQAQVADLIKTQTIHK